MRTDLRTALTNYIQALSSLTNELSAALTEGSRLYWCIVGIVVFCQHEFKPVPRLKTTISSDAAKWFDAWLHQRKYSVHRPVLTPLAVSVKVDSFRSVVKWQRVKWSCISPKGTRTVLKCWRRWSSLEWNVTQKRSATRVRDIIRLWGELSVDVLLLIIQVSSLLVSVWLIIACF